MRRRVLLPAPFSPTRPTTSPDRASRSTPSSTSRPPKLLTMPDATRAGGTGSQRPAASPLRRHRHAADLRRPPDTSAGALVSPRGSSQQASSGSLSSHVAKRFRLVDSESPAGPTPAERVARGDDEPGKLRKGDLEGPGQADRGGRPVRRTAGSSARPAAPARRRCPRSGAAPAAVPPVPAGLRKRATRRRRAATSESRTGLSTPPSRSSWTRRRKVRSLPSGPPCRAM